MKMAIEKGIIILDKPAGITSFEACDAARKKLKAKKTGHAGTLDPAVTGVLIIAVNKATKLMPLLSGLDKTYEGTAHLHKDVSLSKLKQTIKQKFIGKIKQIPPRRSRVARNEREREIYSFDILNKKDRDITYEVHCEKGTYIRKLMDDLGKELKAGAHMTKLRRTKQGPFELDKSVTLEKLSLKDIIPAEKIIEKISPIIHITIEAKERLVHGKFLKSCDIEKIQGEFNKEQIVAAFCEKQLIALINPFFSSQEIQKQEDFVLRPERII